MKTILRNFATVPTLAAVLWLGASALAKADHLSDPAYQEMQRLADRLAEQAQHANDQAQHEQYRIYGRDTGFVRAVSNFARRASQFDDRMANYRSQPWEVDAELRLLLQSARNVQIRVRRSRYINNHTVEDWNETVRVLNRMLRLYQADVDRVGRYDYGTRPQSPGYRDSSGEQRPPGYGDARPPASGGAHSPNAYGYSRERLSTLAHELEERAARAHEQAERLAASNGPRQQEFLETIHHFSEQASAFHKRVEAGLSDPAQIRAEVNHLLDDARQADQGMRQSNVFPEVWQEFRNTMQVLERILNLVGAARPPQPDRREDLQPRPYERDPNLDPAPAPGPRGNPGLRDSRGDQLAGLARELEDRAARALATAEQAAAENGPYRREFMQSIREFNGQAAAFRQSIGAGANNPGQLRAEASRLLDAARQNDQRMRQSNAFREVWPDWQGAMQTLQRILDLLR